MSIATTTAVQPAIYTGAGSGASSLRDSAAAARVSEGLLDLGIQVQYRELQ